VSAGASILNLMVQYMSVDRTFGALADPTRRLVLERLGTGSATISELARPFGMTLTGMKKHIRVLEETQLVATEKVGRARLCHLGPRRLDDVQQWVETYRQMVNEQLDRLGDVLDRTQGDRQ
jgi:DNA-binding transcriptional ArsR family regulator